ncbi:hypothetical protein IHC92_20720 [Photobacterium damselae subsp. damselae]|uniref:hypothetical protein n=1 Tax=Photobacterium damselae TaxID=38293 RepID=UPI001F2BE4EE|nr:hypothetical protein [Photobacterium damselae]UKA23378.1 hypothetical protein IHC92_20720 [Photobacterium damselae subsp. damselae]
MRTMPLGMPRFRGHSDIVRSVVFDGDVKAGCAVSKTAVSGSQMKVVPFNGANFFGFAVHDLCSTRKTSSVIRQGEAVCLRVKEGVALSLDSKLAVDNTTGEIVIAGTAASTPINADVEEVEAIGLDENLKQVPKCAIINVYLGAVASSASVMSVNEPVEEIDIDDGFNPTPAKKEKQK